MNSYDGDGRLLGPGGLVLAHQVRVHVSEVRGVSATRFRGWLDLEQATAAVVGGLAGLSLELPGGTRLPVTLGASEGVGRVAVIGSGKLPSRAA